MDDQSIADATNEIALKHRSQIEEETAQKWAARAVAAYQLFKQSGTGSWLLDSAHYYDEAVEHAALADHSGRVLQQVREWVHRYIPHGAI